MALIRGFPQLTNVLYCPTVQAFAGGLETIPLVDGSLRKDEVTCIRVAHFGVSPVTYSSYISWVFNFANFESFPKLF